VCRNGKTDRMRVVAIGGSASAGKTTCAGRVAELLGLNRVVHVDDLSSELQTNGEPHALDAIGDPWRQRPEDLVEQLVEWTRRLHPAILGAIEELAPTGGVIEGEGIDPRLVAGLVPAGMTAVYVIETSPIRLRATFQARPSRARFTALTAPEQDTVVEMNRLYARWLQKAAVTARQPCVRSQPWETLPERIVTAIG
jgi:hypothetical protein